MSTRTIAANDTAALPISVPVKLLSTPSATPEPTAPVMTASPQAPTQPTLSDARLPQYQLGSPLTGATKADAPHDLPLRFLLALPTRAVVIEIAIAIDDEPFSMARQRRVERIVEAVKATPAPDDTVALPPREDIPVVDEDTNGSPLAEDQTDEATKAEADLAPAYQMPSTEVELARRYFVSTETDITDDAVRWLLSTRIDGPPLLLLNGRFQRFRSDQQPAVDVLDTDGDSVLSTDEIAQAVESFTKCDLNRNDVVDYLEIEKVAAARRMLRPRQIENRRLLRLLPSDEDHGEPAIRMTVAFYTGAPQESEVRVEQLDPTLPIENKSNVPLAGGEPSAISLTIDGAPVSLSAVQPQGGVSLDQVSVGAVADGYPLLPAIDPNEDGRFTIRELRRLVERLRELDRDRDGQLGEEELRAPIRLCIGLGATVHRELSDIRTVHGERAPSAINPGPEWFIRMDRNEDADLTRGEFPGTDEQFTELDQDRDGLISGEEAFAFDPQ